MMENRKKQILVVDDSEHNIDLIIDALDDQYRISVATIGPDVLDLMEIILPEIILLDVMMPGMDGYEVCRILKSDYRFTNIPVIFLTALTDDADETKGLALGAVDYITKPFNPHLLAQRVKTHMLLKEHRDHLEEKVKQQSNLLDITQDVTIEIAGKLAEYRDEETGEHITRTKNYLRLLVDQTRQLKKSASRIMDDRYINLLIKSAPLHDIGKVAIPDHILLKPGKLTIPEFEIIKKHTVYGRDIIMNSARHLGRDSFLAIAQEITYSHHEKWDGTGYPEGLKGNDIPLAGRLMALADVYDALISRRIYKPAFSHEKAVRIITQQKGTHFDPDLVEVFLSCEQQFHEIAVTYADPDETHKGRYC